MSVVARQRFTPTIAAGGVTTSVGIVQQTEGASLLLIKWWGGSAATVQAFTAVPCWDGATLVTSIGGGIGTAGSFVGHGLLWTTPAGLALNAVEANGYPTFLWFNPSDLASTRVGEGPSWPIPYPSIQLKLQGNAGASPANDTAPTVDVWVIHANNDRIQQQVILARNAAGAAVITQLPI